MPHFPTERVGRKRFLAAALELNYDWGENRTLGLTNAQDDVEAKSARYPIISEGVSISPLNIEYPKNFFDLTNRFELNEHNNALLFVLVKIILRGLVYSVGFHSLLDD